MDDEELRGRDEAMGWNAVALTMWEEINELTDEQALRLFLMTIAEADCTRWPIQVVGNG